MNEHLYEYARWLSSTLPASPETSKFIDESNWDEIRQVADIFAEARGLPQ